MPRTRFHILLMERIEARIKVVGESVLEGSCKDFDEYKDWVGYVRGLNDALSLCDDIEGEFD